jgi:dTDP-4-dehydrorhamnose 3,5-epimerase
MKLRKTEIEGVTIIEMPVFSDSRGYLQEIYVEPKLRAEGIRDVFVQDNISYSKTGVLRGLHYQLGAGQTKIVRVIRGSILDVCVDLRRGSPSFGQHVQVPLSEENAEAVYVPLGVAHGYYVLEDALILYKNSDIYRPDLERGIIWNDPTLAICWPSNKPLLSAKDAALPRLDCVDQQDLPSG